MSVSIVHTCRRHPKMFALILNFNKKQTLFIDLLCPEGYKSRLVRVSTPYGLLKVVIKNVCF